MSKNICIVPVGNTSLTEPWINALGSELGFDLVFIAYEDLNKDLEDLFKQLGELVRMDGMKWNLFYRYFSGKLEHDYYFFLDDDILLSAQTIRLIFSFAEAKNLDLAQPCLTENSFSSHPQTIQKNIPEKPFQKTNYVEIMNVLASKRALEVIMPTFESVVYGWGLEPVWEKLLDNNKGFTKFGGLVGIISGISVEHTKPVGSRHTYTKFGGDAGSEMQSTMAKYGVRWQN
jgi:hypothetical protein